MTETQKSLIRFWLILALLIAGAVKITMWAFIVPMLVLFIFVTVEAWDKND